MHIVEPTPFGSGLRIGTIAGIRVLVHWSVVVVVGLLSVLLATSVLPDLAPHESSAAYWLTGLALTVLFLAGLGAHEFAHAVVARHYGIPVQRMTLWMLGGLTELGSEPTTARADAAVAAAGPVTSLGVAFVLAGFGSAVGPATLLGSGLIYVAGTNVLLAVFNLLPGAPLDGGRLLRAAVWWRTGDRSRGVAAGTRAGRTGGIALGVLGLVLLLLGDPGGLWLALVGWFIAGAAQQEQDSQQVQHLAGVRVADVMRPVRMICPDWWTVGQLVDALADDRDPPSVFALVDVDGHASGGVRLVDLGPHARRDTDLRLRDLAARRRVPVVRADQDLTEVIPVVRQRGVAVVADEVQRPVGILDNAVVARTTWTQSTVPSVDAPLEAATAQSVDKGQPAATGR